MTPADDKRQKAKRVIIKRKKNTTKRMLTMR